MSLQICNMAGHLIRRLNQISVSVVQSGVRAAGHDLTSVQFAALNGIRAYPGIEQAGLAGVIAYDRATIGGVVDRLEAKALARRTVSKRDRCVRELTLTEQGHAVLQELEPVVVRLQSRILSGLTDEERQEFLRLANKATDAGNSLSRAPVILPKA